MNTYQQISTTTKKKTTNSNIYQQIVANINKDQKLVTNTTS